MEDLSKLATIYIIVAGTWLLAIIITLLLIYKRKDLSRIVKYFWTVVIIMAPVLGLVAYFIWGTTRNRRESRKALDERRSTDKYLN